MASKVLDLLTGGALDGVSKIINSIKGKSPEDAAKLQELTEKYQEVWINAQIQQRAQDLQALQMQADVNKVEAASTRIWVSGWRPYVGWICGTGLALQFIVAPLSVFIASLCGKNVPFPVLNTELLVTLIFGMLGIGGMRTIEKLQGKA